MRNQTITMTGVWLALVTGTLLAWFLGHHNADSPAMRLAPAVAATIIAVAFSKISLVMAYFMELRWAPYALCAVAAGWVLIEGSLLIWFFTR